MPDKKISQLTTVFQPVFDDVTAINDLGVTKKTPLFNLKNNLFTQFPGLSSATRSAMGATLTGGDKWIGGVLAPNGKIYGIPYESTDILQTTPELNTSCNLPLETCMSAYYNKF